MARSVANPRGNTAGQHSFAVVPGGQIERSAFNRSFGVKTTFNSGYLIPVYADEALPGDTFTMRMTSLVRMSTPLFPVMDNMYLDVFFFSVPIRLIWDNWQKFMGEKEPLDYTDYLTPILTTYAPATGSLSDYLGIPARGVNAAGVCSFWHRAYNLIYNEWFRDENLTASIPVDKDDGPDAIADYVLRRRTKRHDYFTSALPFLQKGNPVTLPLGTVAPVVGKNEDITMSQDGVGGSTRTIGSPLVSSMGPSANWPGAGVDLRWVNTALEVNLSAATAATVNALRQAFQIQKLLERDARGGTRYTEILRSHFGVVSPDQRLQRPEYLGGGSTRINVHPIARTTNNTAANLTTNGVGLLGGFATAQVNGVGFFKSFSEHCVLLGIVNVRADLTYQQGLNKMFTRRSRYDFYWPEFAHLGEQAILNKEIYMNADANDDLVFGYQERFAEYRYKPSIITGVMNSAAVGTMDGWHLGLNFVAVPLLNTTFIEDQPPMSRVLAVTTQPEFFGDFYFDYRCARPMPTFSVPGLIDHF